MKYREIIPSLSAAEEWKEIRLNTGATHSTLQDIKVQKQASGFCYRNDEFIRNRFIYWRTSDDILELSENSLDLNLRNKNLRIIFEEAPILSVNINENEQNVFILVVTISNIHRLQFIHPKRGIGANGEQNENSIFTNITQESAKDPTSFYTISNLLAQNVPHCATCFLSQTGEEAYFAVAHTNHLLLFQMNCFNGHTNVTELKNFQILPRLFSNLTDAIRGKSNVNDSNYVTSIVFDTVGGEIVLYALYRDNNLRMWSTRTGQCLHTLNIINDSEEKGSQGTQNNILKKSTSSTSLCVFLSYTSCSEFQLFKPTWDGANSYTIVPTNFITAPQFDLVDFELTEQRLWGLWCNSEGDMHISAYSLDPEPMEYWRTAVLEGISEKRRTVEADMDAKHIYCSNIFRPGNFQSSTISKALMMFSRSTNFSDAFTPLHILKERVCQAIDAEIQNEIKMHDLSEDEYIEVAINNWEKFYSCCEQYQIAAHQPIGIFVLDSLDAVCVIKNSLMSFLRPCDVIENMLLSGRCLDEFRIDERLKEDLTSLVKVAYYLENHLSIEVKTEISNNIFKLRMPNDIVMEMISDMLLDNDELEASIPKELIVDVADRLKSIRDAQSALSFLLNLLRLDRNNFPNEEFNEDLTVFQRQLFAGNYGTSILTETVRQISSSRYAMCRNLLIIQHILIDNGTLNCNEAEIIRSKHIPETVIFLQSYYVMVWISEDAFAIPQTKTNVIGFNNQGGYSQPSSLLQLFVKNKGLQTSLKLFFKSNAMDESDEETDGGDYETENFWSKNLLSIANYIERFIWAISGSFIFGEWLAETEQNLLVEEYVRLLNKWCEYHSCSRHFILAMSYLNMGETFKAYDMFIESAKGVLYEPYLKQFVNSNELETENEIMSQYYLKVMRLFEKHEIYDCVISIAEVAIGTAEKESQLAMFQSIIFNNHMNLKHFEEAYHSLIHNVEMLRRKDCLRQLVIMLFQEKRFDILIKFPYIGLEQDLQDIVETRARSMQIENNEHYNFLYSYHIKNNNMKQAAIVMHEKALRFLHECSSVESLQMRYNSLLSCFNALSLVDPDYKWLAKPGIEDPRQDEDVDDAMESDVQSQIVVIEIEDIRKELLIVEALLCVAKAKELKSMLNMGPKELVILLAQQKFFTNALKLAKGFKLSLTPLFESLTLACLRSSNPEFNESLEWLSQNNLSDLTLTISYSEMPWMYLKKLLMEEDLDKEYLRDVVKCVLANQAFVPQWLVDIYKIHKASELLYLYLQYGRLDEAAELAVEYVRAFLGSGSELFGFKYYVAKTLPSFPINTMDLLLHQLKVHGRKDKVCEENYQLLKETIDKYLVESNRITLESMAM
ncbi:CLUMA_CG017499, isoform A [Clunio marinus]|uniref:CLUMA_CG017499, isoform A n=1 Tax=Clunio marinus TaxID=568069 RepID=A0A1J1IW28_9DIPT|nr:CLUMA_CG017499, isoform A [Clunio marinus]